MSGSWAAYRVTMQAAVSRALAPIQPDRVALLHPGRVGSELLGGLLRASSRIHWSREFVNDLVHPLLDPPGDYSGRLVGRLALPLDVALSHHGWRAGPRLQVVKTKRLHFAAAGIDDVNDASQVLDHAGMHRRIVLQRRNLVRSIVSWMRAIQLRHAHAYRPEDVPREPIEIPLDAIPTRLGHLSIEQALGLREEDCAWINAVAGPDALHLVYEDDLQFEPERCIENLASYLGLAPWKATATTVPTGAAPLKALLINHDELVARLRGTRWESMIAD